MKKLLSFVIVVSLVLGVLCMGVGAKMSEEEIFDNAEYAFDRYLFYAELLGGYFGEGESPDASTIEEYFRWRSSEMSSIEDEYLIEMDEYGFGTYHIPADVYESHVLSVFGNEEAVLAELHSAGFYKTEGDAPYYEVMVGGGFGDMLPELSVRGYNENENGTFTIYANVLEYIFLDEEWNASYYIPDEDAVEGVDFEYVSIYDSYYDEDTDTYVGGTRVVPAQITGGIRSVVRFEEDQETCYYSYERVALSDLPSNDDLVAPEKGAKVVYEGGAFVTLDWENLGDGKLFSGTEYYSDNEDNTVFEDTKTAFKEYGVLCTVSDLMVTKDGVVTEPDKAIPVSFELPNELSPDTKVYFIDEEGTVTELPTSIDTDRYEDTLIYATVDMERSGRYVVAGVLYGDSDEDGKVAVSDVSTMLKDIAKWDVTMNDISTDVNRDGKVNLSDVSMLLKYIARWDVTFG